MNGVAYLELSRISRAQIHRRLNERSMELFRIRDQIKTIVKSGKLTAKEAQDMVCCLAECLGDDIREVKESLTEVSCDLDGIIHYGSND